MFTHSFHSKFLGRVYPQRNTRQVVNQNNFCFVLNRCLTEQFSLVPYSVCQWNLLPNDIVDTSKWKINRYLIQHH